MIHLPWEELVGRSWRLDDLLAGDTYERDGHDMAANGLYVALPAWGSHLFVLTPIGAGG
jgi:hypothetical protein